MISLFGSIYSTIVYFNIFNITCDSVLPFLPPTLPQTLPCSFKSIASFFISCYYICILYVYMSLYIYLYTYMHVIQPVQLVHCHLYACFSRLTTGAYVQHFLVYHCSLSRFETSWTLPVHSDLHIGVMFGKSCW